MNWMMVLGAGLLAGATTCAATQGGLLVGLIARQRRAAGVVAARGTTTLADDLAPVSGFLAGKLLSHTLAGLLLGALGALAGFDPRVGAVAQWLAGLVMIALGLGALGVPGFRDLRFTPPAAWLDIVRRSSRSRSAAAPFLLGLAVVFVPCGVTISMAVLAASSGSAWAGAAVMFLFVLGTAPMFLLFGFLSQRLGAARRLNLALGALVVGMGLVSLNAGLVASGSPYSLQALTGSDPVAVVAGADAALPPSQPGDRQVIRIEATSSAYVPNVVTARAGVPIDLVFSTDNVWSCTRALRLPTLGQSAILPATGEHTIALDALEPGEYPIVCSMGMYSATLVVA